MSLNDPNWGRVLAAAGSAPSHAGGIDRIGIEPQTPMPADHHFQIEAERNAVLEGSTDAFGLRIDDVGAEQHRAVTGHGIG